MLVPLVRVGRKNRFMELYVPCLRSRAIIPYRGQFYKGKFSVFKEIYANVQVLEGINEVLLLSGVHRRTEVIVISD